MTDMFNKSISCGDIVAFFVDRKWQYGKIKKLRSITVSVELNGVVYNRRQDSVIKLQGTGN